MAILTLTYDTGAVPISRIVDAFATKHEYQATIDGAPNPESKTEFARRMLRNYIVSVVREEEYKAAARTADAAIATINIT